MHIAAIADLHGHLPTVPACDVLVIAGDVTPTDDHDPAFQSAWLDTTFRAWLDRAPATHVVGIAGNHDFIFERSPDLVPGELPWHYLQDSGVTIEGVRFWGSPWTPWFFDWAFNAPKGEEGEVFLAERYATVPEDTDVLLIHGPPRGYGDHTASGMDVGSTAELALIERVRPAAAIFGHIHEGRGRWAHAGVDLANVAAVDLQYQLRPEPFMRFDVS